MEKNENGKWIEVNGKVTYIDSDIKKEEKDETKEIVKGIIATTLVGIAATIGISASLNKINEYLFEHNEIITNYIFELANDENPNVDFLPGGRSK